MIAFIDLIRIFLFIRMFHNKKCLLDVVEIYSIINFLLKYFCPNDKLVISSVSLKKLWQKLNSILKCFWTRLQNMKLVKFLSYRYQHPINNTYLFFNIQLHFFTSASTCLRSHDFSAGKMLSSCLLYHFHSAFGFSRIAYI